MMYSRKNNVFITLIYFTVLSWLEMSAFFLWAFSYFMITFFSPDVFRKFYDALQWNEKLGGGMGNKHDVCTVALSGHLVFILHLIMVSIPMDNLPGMNKNLIAFIYLMSIFIVLK